MSLFSVLLIEAWNLLFSFPFDISCFAFTLQTYSISVVFLLHFNSCGIYGNTHLNFRDASEELKLVILTMPEHKVQIFRNFQLQIF